MLSMFTLLPFRVRKRLRTSTVVLAAALVGPPVIALTPWRPALRNESPVVPSSADTEADTVTTLAADSVTVTPVASRYDGRLFGPVNLWKSYTQPSWGPSPFTGIRATPAPAESSPRSTPRRGMSHRLMLAMTDGPSQDYMSNGRSTWGSGSGR